MELTLEKFALRNPEPKWKLYELVAKQPEVVWPKKFGECSPESGHPSLDVLRKVLKGPYGYFPQPENPHPTLKDVEADLPVDLQEQAEDTPEPIAEEIGVHTVGVLSSSSVTSATNPRSEDNIDEELANFADISMVDETDISPDAPPELAQLAPSADDGVPAGSNALTRTGYPPSSVNSQPKSKLYELIEKQPDVEWPIKFGEYSRQNGRPNLDALRKVLKGPYGYFPQPEHTHSSPTSEHDEAGLPTHDLEKNVAESPEVNAEEIGVHVEAGILPSSSITGATVEPVTEMLDVSLADISMVDETDNMVGTHSSHHGIDNTFWSSLAWSSSGKDLDNFFPDDEIMDGKNTSEDPRQDSLSVSMGFESLPLRRPSDPTSQPPSVSTSRVSNLQSTIWIDDDSMDCPSSPYSACSADTGSPEEIFSKLGEETFLSVEEQKNLDMEVLHDFVVNKGWSRRMQIFWESKNRKPSSNAGAQIALWKVGIDFEDAVKNKVDWKGRPGRIPVGIVHSFLERTSSWFSQVRAAVFMVRHLGPKSTSPNSEVVAFLGTAKSLFEINKFSTNISTFWVASREIKDANPGEESMMKKIRVIMECAKHGRQATAIGKKLAKGAHEQCNLSQCTAEHHTLLERFANDQSMDTVIDVDALIDDANRDDALK
ncbi:hypothetical protein GALMADRAFT_139780 [Galerina marginata CBS 339.88]|uniref:HAM1-like N-terminal domain-containing protein n=1 Tax=Galerina marginata (strain CBS 339.88) TaxID=685588 RepID=A0A067SYM0_GALM3|nr:hypothetical protein GALMADRAFT_139780 [Galerina marginata CBS 339.88]